MVNSRMLDVNGASLYVEAYGDGPPLVLVHGGLSTTSMWFAAGPLLAEHFRIYALDTRGHGRSTNPSGALSYEIIAGDTVAAIDTLGLDRPFIGGYSDGGQVALEIGLRHPEAARALIVAGAMYDFRDAGYQAVMRQAHDIDANGQVDLADYEERNSQWVAMLRQWHGQSHDQWQAVLQQTVPMWLDYAGLSESQIRSITTPSLVVLGDRDESIPVRVGLDMYEWLPEAELAILPGHDHARPFMQPEVFVAAIVDYLKRH